MMLKSIMMTCCLFVAMSSIVMADVDTTQQEPKHHILKFVPQGETKAEPYLIQPPPQIEDGRQYPLMIFLHGAGGSHTQQWLHPDLAELRKQAAEHEYFVLSAHLGASHWFDDRADRVLVELLDKAIAEYPIDSQRVHVMGISMGGGAALGFAVAHPDRVSAVCDVFGLTDLLEKFEARDYRGAIAKQYGGTVENRAGMMRAKSALHNLDAFAKIPVMVFHGTADNVISVEHSRRFVAALKEEGQKVLYIERESIGHTNRILNGHEREIFEYFSAARRQVTYFRTPTGVRYGVLGKKPKNPAPTLFVFSGTIENSLGMNDPYYLQSGQKLSNRGYVCVSVDLPSHGKQHRQDEPEGLSGWRHRSDRGEQFITELNTQLKEVVGDLIRRGFTDSRRIAACGVSRGGFVAYHFAASDDRVRAVAGFSPVTDLRALTEFQGAEQRENVSSLALMKVSDRLAGRAVYLVIGDQDKRVDTDAAVRFARSVEKLSAQAGGSDRVELHVLPEPRGHTVPEAEKTFDTVAKWIEEQLQ